LTEKKKKSNRYKLTAKAKVLIPAIIAARGADIDMLIKIAA
jgi:hypothetical protein